MNNEDGESVASVTTGKGSTCPFRRCKVGPQAVFGKIILARGIGIFPKNHAQPGHAPFAACGNGTHGSPQQIIK